MNEDCLLQLVCPEDHSSLALADGSLVARLNAAIDRQRLKNRAGQTLSEHLDAALVRADRTLAYPVIDDIPRLLIDEAILLSQLEG